MSNSPETGLPQTETGDGVRAASRPWWLGIAVIALGGICLYGTTSLAQGARYSAIGPGLFVTIAGGGLVILGIMLLVQIARGEKFEPQDAEDALGVEKANPVALGTALAAVILPVFAIEYLGLPVTAMLSFTLVARAFSSRKPLLDLLYGAILGTAAWFLFTRLGLQLGGFLPLAGF
ncbi:MAG TPA: tripartite tricarboxylate transporter TctB family protein [Devosia sp.]|nr:tripartite tricarboxylate transporter TctB family protein [Devosia sp.]